MPVKDDVEITPAAERDVEEIWTYIADDSPENATAFILRLEEQIEALEQFPMRCPLIPENDILGTMYRQLIYGAYRTTNTYHREDGFHSAIVHGSRSLAPSLFQ